MFIKIAASRHINAASEYNGTLNFITLKQYVCAYINVWMCVIHSCEGLREFSAQPNKSHGNVGKAAM